MNSLKIIALFFAVILGRPHQASADAAVPLPNMYGEAVPGRIHHWTKIIYVGPTTSAPPNIFVSPMKFKRNAPDALIKLSGQEYGFFSSLGSGPIKVLAEMVG